MKRQIIQLLSSTLHYQNGLVAKFVPIFTLILVTLPRLQKVTSSSTNFDPLWHFDPLRKIHFETRILWQSENATVKLTFRKKNLFLVTWLWWYPNAKRFSIYGSSKCSSTCYHFWKGSGFEIIIFRDIFGLEFEFRAELSGQDCLRFVCVRLTLFQGNTLPICYGSYERYFK